MMRTKNGTVVNPDTGPTPPGFNKNLRQSARYALAATSLALLSGMPQLASLFALAAAWCLQQGTAFSVKNFKWRALTWAVVPACLAASSLRNAASNIDQERGYTVYLLVSLGGRCVEFTTGGFVAIVVALAWTAPPEPEKTK